MLIETERLVLRKFTLNDSSYILRQLNEEAFIRYISDKEIRTIEDAERYLSNGPLRSYNSNGFGLYIVETKSGGEPIGMCGLIKRPELDTPDLGFAFLKEHCGNGYATEASQGVLNYEIESRALNRIMAITLPENNASSHVLRKCGFAFIGHVEVNNLKNNLYVYKKGR